MPSLRLDYEALLAAPVAYLARLLAFAGFDTVRVLTLPTRCLPVAWHEAPPVQGTPAPDSRDDDEDTIAAARGSANRCILVVTSSSYQGSLFSLVEV